MNIQMIGAVVFAFLSLVGSDAIAEQSGKVVTQDGKLMFVTAPKSELKVASPMFAKVLPLPGKFDGDVVDNTGSKIGISLKSGDDSTNIIVSQREPIQDQLTDIRVKADGFLGSASSGASIKIPVEVLRTGSLGIAWADGFLSMVKEESRTIRLEGHLTIPVVNPETKMVIYQLEYRFQDNAYVSWDKKKKVFIWANMKVTKIE